MNQPVLHVDETTYQVLENDTQKPVIGPFYQINSQLSQLVFIIMNKYRSEHVAIDFLEEYLGYLNCDTWAAYRQLANTTLTDVGLMREESLSKQSCKMPMVNY